MSLSLKVMQMNNVVEFLATKQITKTVPIRDAYYFKPKGRFIWLQKIAWKFLFKRNSLSLATTFDVSYERYTIDTDDFINAICEFYYSVDL